MKDLTKTLDPLAANDARANWTGAISLDQRLASGELSESDVHWAIDIIGNCYVATTKGASIRCVDGRSRSDYDGKTAHLGPQTAGGTIGDAVDYRVALGMDPTSDLGKDASVLESHEDQYAPGGHTTDGHPEGKTGCGAVDGVEDQEANIVLGSQAEIESKMKDLLGELFSLKTFHKVSESTKGLIAAKDKYFKQKNAELHRIDMKYPGSVPVLSGSHNEVLVAVNMVNGTTLQTDHFNSLSGGKIQAFGYDFWRTEERAKSLFPDNHELQLRYIHAQLARSISALMGLTDGSLILHIRRTA